MGLPCVDFFVLAQRGDMRMSVRFWLEQDELSRLAERASFSVKSRGRRSPEQECDMRTVYQRDRDRIVHSKAFRRLIQKTQVFISPEADHYRTRLTHTVEVAQISRTIARALRLNEDLTEAIALGHDIGHTPFGHAGESALNETFAGGFRHNEQSLRVVDILEKRNDREQGLNLTWEVRDGIRNHTGDTEPETLEGQIVRIADRVAYINHDIDDAIRAGIICEGDLPLKCTRALGHYRGMRINTMVRDIITASTDRITMSSEISEMTSRLRRFLFERVYHAYPAKDEADKAKEIVKQLYYYLVQHKERFPEVDESIERTVCDYIAGMTDRFALAKFEEIFMPRAWRD